MSFTYELGATGDNLTISEIRLEIGDTDNEPDQGVKPTGANFSDAELLHFYQKENSNVLLAAARACEVLARMWSRVDESVRIRDYQITARQQASNYRSLAADLRSRVSGGIVSVALDREDGYGDHAKGEEYA